MPTTSLQEMPEVLGNLKRQQAGQQAAGCAVITVGKDTGTRQSYFDSNSKGTAVVEGAVSS